MTRLVWIALSIALRKNADIYHLHDPELLPLGLILRYLGKAVVYDMHENVPQQVLDKPWLPVLVRKPLKLIIHAIERLCLNRMAVVMAERSYRDDYPWVKRVEVVLNFPLVDDLLNLRCQKHCTLTVGYIGGVSASRGAITLLEALRVLRNAGLQVNFLCIGEVHDEVANNRLFIEAVRDGWLQAPGRIPPREGWQLIAACHVGVAILKPIGNYLGSYPTKMFEYMAMGLPTVVSNFPLYRDVVENHQCGVCVDPNDTNAIADALKSILLQPDLASKMGKRGKAAVRNAYNWDSELKKLNDFYRSVMMDRLRPS
jgi:glycosyltransferase involved in cell wall biosynthesis